METRKPDILVTGATGLLGIHLVRRLVQNGHQVRILARKTSPLWPLKNLPLEINYGDITDPKSVKAAVRGCDTVFHLAGYVSLGPFKKDLAEQTNVGGTKNILAACREAGVKRLIHTSSMTTIAEGSLEQPATEDSPWNLNHLLNIPYYDTKKRAEELVLKATSRGQIDAVIINPALVFGPFDLNLSTAQVIQIVSSGRFIFYPLGGASLVSAEDIASGAVAAWQRGVSGERYILGGENLDYKTMLIMIADRLGVSPPRFRLPAILIPFAGWGGDFICRLRSRKHSWISSTSLQVYNTRHYVSSEKAKRDLGYRFRDFGQTLDKTIDWLRCEKMI